MISITRHIEYLITCHDCVIVPGWGAFIAHSSSAHIIEDPAGATILMPPTRTLSFNPGINHNDGLLVTSVMRREGLSYETALQEIERQVCDLRHELETAGEITLPRIGSFTFNPEGAAPLFSPAADSLASAPYFGLPKLRPLLLAPAVTKTQEGQKDQAEYILPAADNKKTVVGPIHKVIRVAASVALLLGLGIVISTPITVDRSESNFASVDPSAAIPKVTGPKSAKIITDRFVPRIPDDAELSIAIPAKEATEEATESRESVSIKNVSIKSVSSANDAVETASRKISAVEPVHASARYYLIVASLESRRRADQYLATANDPTLRILEEEGRYRVYAATGNSVKEAEQRKSDPTFSAAHPEAWVYRSRK